MLKVSIIIQESAGIRRVNEPVTLGIPFPKGMVFNSEELVLSDEKSNQIPLQAQTLVQWQDNSIKWVLLDFQATVLAMTTIEYQLYRLQDLKTIDTINQGISITQQPRLIVIDTGAAIFYLNRQILQPFKRVVVQGVDLLVDSQIILADNTGEKYEHRITEMEIETNGHLRTTIKSQGKIISTTSEVLADFICRLSFYANSTITKIDYTIRNPNAAKHPDGLWDLGDEGSIYFKDLSILIRLQAEQSIIEWITEPNLPVNICNSNKLVIYQDSSGGENWKSSNHVNRNNQVMNTFQGYRVYDSDIIIKEGKRAEPIVVLRDGNKRIETTIVRFWQNFPKAIEAENNTMKISLFPTQYADVFELQGGEQKTHTVFFNFEIPPTDLIDLSWVQSPLIPMATSQWYANTMAINYLVPQDTSCKSEDLDCQTIIDSAINGDNSFFKRREIIDEYGWRNFGDIYADHEAIGHKGNQPLIAHYNNQYDVIYGAVIQYLRKGDAKWFELMDDLARHVRDIDIYHTSQDRAVYNNGLFWHTDHYTDAATATHRCFSQKTLIDKGLSSYGGGLCNEHNYTTGLMYHYLLTGEKASKEVAIGLADWVIDMDDGTKTRFRFFDRRFTGFASSTAERDYHKPGRGCGNSINTLIDAHILTKENRFIKKAEQLIQRSIHPMDDIEKLNLTEPEIRWSYTVFLQALGKYLDYKLELGQTDYMYCYAKESLIHYADWMAKNEVRVTTIMDRVEIPTETWPAQDIRKSNVFKFASRYSKEPLRSKFLEKSDFFFNACINDLLTFKTRTLTRPVVILMANSYMQAYFQQHSSESIPDIYCEYDFGKPQRFKPQVCELYKIREKLMSVIQAIKRR